eukprot:scaffold143008_cov19-Tisochrysis_lutea.AAC.1
MPGPALRGPEARSQPTQRDTPLRSCMLRDGLGTGWQRVRQPWTEQGSRLPYLDDIHQQIDGLLEAPSGVHE